MAKLNRSNLTRLFKGFRPGVRVVHKINLKYLEKLTVLTSLQHNIVKDALNRCAFTKEEKYKTKEGKEKTKNRLVISLDPWYIARLVVIMDKPFNEAKVNYLGNPWEAAKELTEEDKKKMQEEVKAKGRKGKSRKDIKKEMK